MPALRSVEDLAADDLARATHALATLHRRGGGVATASRVRTGAAWAALRGHRVGPPVAVARWPWALGAAVAGAVLGVAIAELARRLVRADAPDAVPPEDLVAVVDRAR